MLILWAMVLFYSFFRHFRLLQSQSNSLTTSEARCMRSNELDASSLKGCSDRPSYGARRISIAALKLRDRRLSDTCVRGQIPL